MHLQKLHLNKDTVCAAVAVDSEMNPYCEKSIHSIVDNDHGKFGDLHIFLVKEIILEHQFLC